MLRVALAAFVIVGCSTPRHPATDVAPAPGTGGFRAIPREQTADQQIAHALNRLTFGPRPGDADTLRRIGLDAWIDRQLHPERMDDSALDRFLADNYPLLDESPAALELRYPPPGQIRNAVAGRSGGAGAKPADRAQPDSAEVRRSLDGLRAITAEVQSARVARAVLGERQLLEVMTDFWLNHFNVYDGKGPRERYMIAEYENRVIRPNALGRFRTLLGSVAKSEAMLFYLDNWQSQADSTRPTLASLSAPRRPPVRAGRGAIPGLLPPPPARPAAQPPRSGLNENYGRELLELHTLGVDGGYTQSDVINAARALTGWTIRGARQGGGFVFVPARHDAGVKVVLGHTLAAGRGIEDGEELLDIVARHPSTARFIAFKLARRFVSDSPSTALVARAAATFTRTDGDIRETLRTIIMSPEFFSRAAYRSKVKSPFEVVVSAARALGAQPDPTPRTAQFVAQLGEPLYGHQAPNGWPETADQWINTGSILARINFGMLVAAGRMPGASPFGFSGAAALQGAPQAQQVNGVVAGLLGGDASPETLAVLQSGVNPLARPDTSVVARAAATDAGGAVPPISGQGRGRGGGRASAVLPPLRGIPLIVGLALGSPEFQRR